MTLPPPGTVQPKGGDIKVTRELKGWSQQKLADEADMSKTTVNSVEKSQPCYPATLKRITDALELEMEDVIEWVHEEDPPTEPMSDGKINFPQNWDDFDETRDLIALISHLKARGLGPIIVLPVLRGSVVVQFRFPESKIGQLLSAFKEGLLLPPKSRLIFPRETMISFLDMKYFFFGARPRLKLRFGQDVVTISRRTSSSVDA